MRRTTLLILLLLLTLAAPAATAAQWVAPQRDAVLGAIEVVQVRALATDMPTLVPDPAAAPKGSGIPLRELECDGDTCLWEGFLDTRGLAAGAHTLGLTGVTDPPANLPVQVDNERRIERLHLWKDPYNPWPSDVAAGTQQRRLVWLANLGSDAQTVAVAADVDPDWTGLHWVEVTTSAQAPPRTTFRLEPGATIQIMLTGTAVGDSGVIEVTAHAGAASANLRDTYGTPTAGAPSLGAVTVAVALVALAAARSRRF